MTSFTDGYDAVKNHNFRQAEKERRRRRVLKAIWDVFAMFGIISAVALILWMMGV